MYRYHTLDAVRRKARSHGYRGALYAWESADTATPRTVVTPSGQVVTLLTGEREHHISADIAYAVWQYWHATGDDGFLLLQRIWPLTSLR
jgi:trehalose/maltose hydrolase-like predicted phosphorylase